MANRYWVGGTASWDGTAGTKWSDTSGGSGGFSVPTTADDVFFDGASGASTVTIATGNTGAKSITCTGFTGTITGTIAISVAGSITLVAGMTYTHTGTVTITGAATLTTAGKSFSALTVSAPGNTVTLGDALNIAARLLSVSQGTFDTANFNITAGSLTSTGSIARTINLGSSTLTLSGNAAVSFSGSNLTFNAGTSSLSLSGGNVTFAGLGLTFYNVTFTASGTKAISGANTFNNLTFTPSTTTGISTTTFDANVTVSGTLNCAGAAANRRLFVISNGINVVRTLTVGTLLANDCDFRAITIAGAAAGTSPTRAGDCGNNSGITFPAAKTVYWNLAAGGNWSTAAWAASSGAAPAVTNFPLAQDTAIVEATGLNSGATITVDLAWNIGTVDLSARTVNTATVIINPSPTIYGNWITGTGVTFSGAGTLTFAGVNAQTITSAGRTWTQGISINTGSSVTLLDAFITNRNLTGALTITRGTFNANGYNVTLSGAASSVVSTGSSARTIAIGSGTWTIAGTGGWSAASTGLTITGSGTISLTSASAKTFAGGGANYGGIILDNGGAGALTITGSNIFGALSNTVQPTSFLFTAGTTTTISNWNVSGTAGNLVTIQSVTAATHTLSKASGTVSADYLSITNSVATGGATWYAGANSVDASGNTGWIFTAPPSGSGSGGFFLLM